jgi:Flp pilus assembly protein TadG
MAVVTPLLLTMIFGMMELGWAFMIKESLTNATRDACRVGVLQGSTESEIRARFASAVAPIGLEYTDDMLIITPASPANNNVVTVKIDVPYSNISLLGLGSFLGVNPTSLGATCSMRQEG